MSAEPQSRIARARARAETAKRGLAAAGAVAFLAALVLARASHPGQAAQPASSTGSTPAFEDDEGSQSFDFGSGSIAPSDGFAPSVGTHAS